LTCATPQDKEASTSQGEWSDWENDAHVDDDYSEEEGDDYAHMGSGLLDLMKYAAVPPYQTTIHTNSLQEPPSAVNSSVAAVGYVSVDLESTTSSTTTTSQSRDADYWKGWSEEAPYFDEYDVQDDEGNWGRADENIGDPAAVYPVLGAGSSDLWTRAIPSWAADKPTSILPEVTNISSDKVTIDSSDIAATTTATIILSRLQRLEERLDARLDGISSSLLTANPASPDAVPAHPIPLPAMRLQLPPPIVVVLYMVLFATIQALTKVLFQRR